MLLSSVAERVYWMSRYIERAENTARIILVNHNLLLDMPRTKELGWEPLVAIMGSREAFYEHHAEATERNVIRYLVSDPHNPNSLVACLAQARENLRTTRAILPRSAWETLNDVHAYASENKAAKAIELFDAIESVDSCASWAHPTTRRSNAALSAVEREARLEGRVCRMVSPVARCSCSSDRPPRSSISWHANSSASSKVLAAPPRTCNRQAASGRLKRPPNDQAPMTNSSHWCLVIGHSHRW